MAQRPSGRQTEIGLHPLKSFCPAKETARDGKEMEGMESRLETSHLTRCQYLIILEYK